MDEVQGSTVPTAEQRVLHRTLRVGGEVTRADLVTIAAAARIGAGAVATRGRQSPAPFPIHFELRDGFLYIRPRALLCFDRIRLQNMERGA